MKTTTQRFESHIDPSPTAAGCRLWVGCGVYDGYGKFTVGGRLQKKSIRAHRFAWELARGRVPGGLCVLHRCDNRRCVNVDHLFLGTRADNNADKEAKGRALQLRGEANGNSKLSREIVAEIRSIYANGVVSQKKLAARFGVHQTVVGDIVRGETWST